MQKFTKEQIEGARQHFTSQGFNLVDANVAGTEFQYFELPSSLETSLPNFAFRATGEPQDGYVVGVSTDIPEEFRPYAAFHEFTEFTQIGIDTPGRCALASQRELAAVPDELNPEYAQMRKEFFENLKVYAEAKPETYSASDIDEFAVSLKVFDDFLRSK